MPSDCPVRSVQPENTAERIGQIIACCENLAAVIAPGMRSFAEQYLKQLLDERGVPDAGGGPDAQ